LIQRLLEVQRRALESQRDELRSEVEQYESLREGKISTLVVEDFAELPTALIKARIAQRLTQKELAQRLGVKEQQVQRWEANDYAGASIETLRSVIEALGVATREELFVPSSELKATLEFPQATFRGAANELWDPLEDSIGTINQRYHMEGT